MSLMDLSWRQTMKKESRKREGVTAAGSQWEMWVWGKELELGKCGKDVARFLSTLSPLFLAAVRCVGISHVIFPTSGVGWRGGVLSWKQVLCQTRFSWCWAGCCQVGKHILEIKTSCILTESEEHWPPVICLWDDLEAELWLCFFCLLKFKIQPVRD